MGGATSERWRRSAGLAAAVVSLIAPVALSGCGASQAVVPASSTSDTPVGPPPPIPAVPAGNDAGAATCDDYATWREA